MSSVTALDGSPTFKTFNFQSIPDSDTETDKSMVES